MGCRLAAVIAAGAVATACGSSTATINTGTEPSASGVATIAAGGVVPWVNRPAALPPLPTVSPPAPRFPACTAANLQARGAPGGAATGHLASLIKLTNISSSGCTLSGFPTSFTATQPDGRHVALRVGHGTFFDSGDFWPANLEPGQTSTLTIETGDVCPAVNNTHPQADPYVGATVGIPGGGTISVGVTFDGACGVSISQLGKPAPPPPDPDAYPGLQLSVHRPQTAAAGSVMHFTVTLTNSTATAVALDPCPIYEEGIYTDRASSRTYQLNCDRVTSIAPGQAVTYAMQINVPPDPGTAKFGWSIPAGSLFGGGMLTIT